MNNYTVGVMTGNSMDAADAVLVDFSAAAPRLLKSASVPIDSALTESLRRLANNETVSVTEVLAAQNALTDTCAAAVKALALPPSAACAIGCHGQTIAHRPAAAATWQLLSGARLAEQCGLDVICDFRARDIASGGQGAPLAPFFHQYYCAAHVPCAVVNIGGIANITRLAADGTVTHAYDTGPGMLLLDAFYRQNSGTADGYDKDGALAQQGSVNSELLQTLLAHPYLALPPPKSCGREEFSLALLPDSAAHLPPADVQATLLEFTARTIAAAAEADTTVFLCGGGSINATLQQRLTELLPQPPQSTDSIGLPAQLVEAAAFAYLACCFLNKTPLVAAPVTGGKTRLAGAYYPC